MSDTKLNDEPDTYPDSFIDWITSLDTKEIIRSMWLKMSIEERKEFVEQDEEHTCKMCSEMMDDEAFQQGKMCCDKPMFHDDHDDEEEYEDDHPNERLCCICHNWLPSDKVTKLYIRNDKEGEWYCFNCPLSSW